MGRKPKLSGAQSILLHYIAHGKLPRRYQWNTMAKLKDLGLVEFVTFRLAGHDCGEYRLTEAGKQRSEGRVV